MKDKLSKEKNLVKKYCADFDERENLCGIE